MVVLGLLGCLQHGLERLPLVSRVQRLNDAVLGKISSVTCLEARVEAILKSSTQAHGEVSLTGEWASSTHELLEVGLNRADNLITVAVRMHLADMIDGGVWLRRVAWA